MRYAFAYGADASRTRARDAAREDFFGVISVLTHRARARGMLFVSCRYIAVFRRIAHAHSLPYASRTRARNIKLD